MEVTHAGAAAEESEGGVSTAPRPEVAQVSHVGATVAEESEDGGRPFLLVIISLKRYSIQTKTIYWTILLE